EGRALGEALVRQGAAQHEAIGDALVFRAYRRSVTPGAAAEERSLELSEGLAEYTGYRLSGWPAGVLADRVAQRLEREDGGDTFTRSFAYASGPAYGVLLDESGASWRRGLTSSSDLGAMLAKRAGVTLPASLEAEARRR